MAYEELAGLYDLLMEDINYEQWADYIHRLLEQSHCPGNRILDLGCGTGNITIPLAQRGYRMTGVDLSEPMLEQAQTKSRAMGLDIVWQQQDMTNLQLEDENGEEPVFDAVIATFDAFNYLLDPYDLQDLLHRLNAMLVDGGLLIFDVQTPYKLQEYLGNQIYTLHRLEVEYVWENHFDEEEQICQMDITFFIRQENGLYRRVTECHRERVYDLDILQLWLQYSDFTLLGRYRELTNEEVQPEDHRAVFIATPTLYEEEE